MGSENGFEIIEQMKQAAPSCLCVLITSSSDDALNAFRLHPFDYVVKPWKEETIFRVMSDTAGLFQDREKSINIMNGRQRIKLFLSDIHYAVSDNHHVRIATKSQEEIRCFSTFKDMSEKLLSDQRFLARSRGIIVNMDFIDKFQENCFVMKNGKSLPIKVKDIAKIKNSFSEYVFNRTRRWSV